MVSTVVRQTLIQMTTPDDMRGRVFAVNSLFYGTATHLGSFRAGVMAELIGAVGSVLIGGCAIVATVACGHGCSRRCAASIVRMRCSRSSRAGRHRRG